MASPRLQLCENLGLLIEVDRDRNQSNIGTLTRSPIRRHVGPLRRVASPLVGAAEKLEQWQKAVDAAHRANQLPPYHTRELAAWNSAAAAFEKLGVNLHELLYARGLRPRR
jgi:hypothetical protein